MSEAFRASLTSICLDAAPLPIPTSLRSPGTLITITERDGGKTMCCVTLGWQRRNVKNSGCLLY